MRNLRGERVYRELVHAGEGGGVQPRRGGKGEGDVGVWAEVEGGFVVVPLCAAGGGREGCTE